MFSRADTPKLEQKALTHIKASNDLYIPDMFGKYPLSFPARVILDVLNHGPGSKTNAA